MVTYVNTKAISSTQQNYYLGRCFSQSNIINTTSNITGTIYYGTTASGIWNGSEAYAAVILIGVDGNFNYFRGIAAGTILPFKHIGITASATINGFSITTDALYMTWVGGES